MSRMSGTEEGRRGKGRRDNGSGVKCKEGEGDRSKEREWRERGMEGT